MPAHREQDMTIDLESGNQVSSAKLDPLCTGELGLLRKYLDEMLNNGKIHSGKSSASAPIFFAKQTNGKF